MWLLHNLLTQTRHIHYFALWLDNSIYSGNLEPIRFYDVLNRSTFRSKDNPCESLVNMASYDELSGDSSCSQLSWSHAYASITYVILIINGVPRDVKLTISTLSLKQHNFYTQYSFSTTRLVILFHNQPFFTIMSKVTKTSNCRCFSLEKAMFLLLFY